MWTSKQVAGGALMKLGNRGGPNGSPTIAAPVMARAVKSAMSKDLVRLDQRLPNS